MATTSRYDTQYSGGRSNMERRGFASADHSRIDKRITGGKNRRKDKRFRVKDFTFVKLWSASNEDIGQLLDISKRGLSLRYFVYAKHPSNFSQLGIFSSGSDLAIDGIPFRVVSDTELPDGSPFGPIIFRRSGVQFGQLTFNQLSALDYFIKKNTRG